MTLELHTVSLKATDGISPVMRTVATNTQSATAQMEQSFERTTRSTERFSKAGAAMGSALGAGILLFGEFGRAAAEEEAVFARLEQAVEATGKSYLDYSDAIDRAISKGEDLAFSDDQVADALSRMTTTTGDAQAALDNIGLAMDLARARGIDLSAAADLIGKAYTGNFAALSRYGITLNENATATEALAAIQQKTAGQAEAYGNTQAAAIDRAKNSLDNFTESLGAHAGELSTLVALLPGLTAGWTILAGAAGGVTGALGGGAGAAGATGALTAFGVSLASLGVAVAALTPAVALLAYTVYTAKDNMEAVTKETDAIGEALTSAGLAADEFALRLYGAFSQNLNLTEYTDPVTGLTFTLESAFDELVALRGEFQAQFIEIARSAEIDLANPTSEQITFLIDQLLYFYRLQNEVAQNQLEINRAQGLSLITSPDTATVKDVARLSLHTDQSRASMGQRSVDEANTRQAAALAANDLALSFKDAIEYTNSWSAAQANASEQIRKQFGLYAGLVEGIDSATDAQNAFWQSQQNVLAEQTVYSQQQSEYQGQLANLEAGYKILQERQAAGVALTKDEQNLLENYPRYYERLTGGIEDAAVAEAILTGQYVENMLKGDQLNDSLAGNTDATGRLVDIIEDLILSLDGVPEEVRSRIEIDNAIEAKGELEGIVSYLNSIDGRTATFYVNAAGTGVSLGSPDGVGILQGDMLGGIIPGAAHGRVMGGGYTLVGEAGPELIAGGQGGMVIPASATRARLRGGAGGDTFQFNAPIMVYANNPQQFAAQMREQYVGGARQ